MTAQTAVAGEALHLAPVRQERFTLTYMPELDGLRAVAAMLVILFHADPRGFFSGGFVGVDIFFVLSSFLITALLVEEWDRGGRIRIRYFYWRRAVRLMPALLLLLAVYLVVAPMLWPGHPHGRDALVAGLYLSDYGYSLFQTPTFLAHTWSLSVEEHFYLIWPLLLLPLLRAKNPLLIMALVWLVLTNWRLQWSGDWLAYYFRFDMRSTGLVLGAMLFFSIRNAAILFRPLHGWLAIAMLSVIAVTAENWDSAWIIAGAEIAGVILIGCLATGQGGLIAAALRSPAAVTLGKLSYGIYLWHYPVAYFLRDQWSYPATVAATFLFSLSAAALSYWTVEAWGRRLKQAAHAQ